MKTIHKYPLALSSLVTIEMPFGAKILSVQCQRNEPQLWALADPTATHERRLFRIYGTGHVVSDDSDLTFIATFQVDEGQVAYHLFEEGRES